MIHDILGFFPSIKKVIAEDSDGNLFAADSRLVAELHGVEHSPKRLCVHAMLNPDLWPWRDFEASNPGLFRATIKQFNKERYGFPVWAKHNSNDPATILGA